MDDIALHRDGILIYEPWYSRIIGTLELFEYYLDLPFSTTVESVVLSEVMGQIVWRLSELGLAITLPIFSLVTWLALKQTYRIYRGVRAKAETAVGVVTSVEATVK